MYSKRRPFANMFAIKPTEVAPLGQVVKVGIVGSVAPTRRCPIPDLPSARRCGMVTQVVHIPTLNSLSHHFRITYLHDVSADAMKHSQLKAAGATKPKTTKEFHELCISAEVDKELLASNHAFHASEVILALKANKHVFTENPIALTLQDTDRIIAADQAAGGSKVFVGYMRRYAAAFVDAVKEVGSIGEIRYARVRDIIGPKFCLHRAICRVPADVQRLSR